MIAFSLGLDERVFPNLQTWQGDGLFLHGKAMHEMCLERKSQYLVLSKRKMKT
jgi:hypothetical protein